jgi:hypothetical protein
MADNMEEVLDENGNPTGKVVTSKEEIEKLKKGSLMQDDYTRKMQELSEQRKALEPLKDFAELMKEVPPDQVESFGKDLEASLARYKAGKITKPEMNNEVAALRADLAKMQGSLSQMEQEKQKANMAVFFDNTNKVINGAIDKLDIEDTPTKDIINGAVWMKLSTLNVNEMKPEDVQKLVSELGKPIAENYAIAKKFRGAGKAPKVPVGDKGGQGGIQSKPDIAPPVGDLEARKKWNKEQLGL